MSSDDMDDMDAEVENVGRGNSAPSAKQTSKFSDAFSKILEKRKSGIKCGNQAGLEKLESKTSKKVKLEKTEELEAKAATRQARTERLALRKRGKRAPSKRGEEPDKDALERRLLVTATRGVVKLFNAVRKEQRVIEEQAPAKATTKRTFLEELKGAATAAKLADSDAPATNPEQPPTQSAASNSTWEVFREDFFSGRNRLRDWDKGAAADAAALGGGDEADNDNDDGDDSDF
mmetsp:Transcript_4182/g.8615  ORF Transcript_4182/g.8615 Transcript_4182/m.8615 type:complete len:233 (-) Transcript_4182:205-903(-)|eukprot:CAMPEP_0118935890 /NCGR_PEP_ID=MMETSP1169-20130426/15889_1 /TAXON_ID=36882 /ORGANISM="Pyramimonas obovata, Strain CCMP722" /LENGTH=232 /DNA_ID=CAMNT_0006878965 /DNA_START=55 /DNA_END=753 /DNA_ORIENTATION=-